VLVTGVHQQPLIALALSAFDELVQTVDLNHDDLLEPRRYYSWVALICLFVPTLDSSNSHAVK
jgi:hypothetical protein